MSWQGAEAFAFPMPGLLGTAVKAMASLLSLGKAEWEPCGWPVIGDVACVGDSPEGESQGLQAGLERPVHPETCRGRAPSGLRRQHGLGSLGAVWHALVSISTQRRVGSPEEGRVRGERQPPPERCPEALADCGFWPSLSVCRCRAEARVWMHTWIAGLLLAPLQSQAGLRREGPGLRKHKLESR